MIHLQLWFVLADNREIFLSEWPGEAHDTSAEVKYSI